MTSMNDKIVRTTFEEAETAARDKTKVAGLVRKAARKAAHHKDKIKTVFDELGLMSQMLVSWAKGDYVNVPWRTIVSALGATLYFLAPLDFLPDIIGILGFVDDIFVVSKVWEFIRKDMDDYQRWKSERPIVATLA